MQVLNMYDNIYIVYISLCTPKLQLKLFLKKKKQKTHTQNTEHKKKILLPLRGLYYTYLLSKQLLRAYPHSNDRHLHYTGVHMCLVFYCQELLYPCKDISHHSVKM